MKTLRHAIAGAALLTLSSASLSLPLTQTINDNYIGSRDYGHGDVIGDKKIFEVDHMDVTFDGDIMSIRVVTKFKESHSAWYRDVHYGDLFISTNGWHPYGAAPYWNDTYGNGEAWELVVDTSEGGKIYDQFGVRLAEQEIHSGTFRRGQEVLRDPRARSRRIGTADLSVAEMNWNGSLWNTLTYSMSMSSLGIEAGDQLGFKWSMTCANDSIEGGASVPELPEPATWLLFAVGSVGLISRKPLARA